MEVFHKILKIAVQGGASDVHTVRGGETLSGIAQQYGLNWRDLAADNVTVVDQDGHLLTRNGADADLDGTQLDYVREVEHRYQQRIESILTPILGAGNVHAQVTAQVDFNRREETDEHYGPNQGNSPAAVRSHQVDFTRSGGQGGPGGIPGALTNTPPGSAASPINNPASAASTGAPNGKAAASSDADPQNGDLHRESTTNYEVASRVRSWICFIAVGSSATAFMLPSFCCSSR